MYYRKGRFSNPINVVHKARPKRRIAFNKDRILFKDRENGQIRRQFGSSDVFPTSAKYSVQENVWAMRHGTEFCFAHPMSGENKLFIYSYKKGVRSMPLHRVPHL